MIDAYLAELGRALARPFLLRRRLLAEAEAHLRDSAEALRSSGLSTEDAEREAVARFGPARAVAGDAVRGAWPRSAVPATLLLVAALVLHALPFYGIPENTLPPAPWTERPDYLTWKLYASLGAYGGAVPCALLAVAAAWRGWARVGVLAFLTSLAAFGVSATLGTILAVQWTDAVPGSGETLALSLPAVAMTVVLGGAAAATAAVHAPSR